MPRLSFITCRHLAGLWLLLWLAGCTVQPPIESIGTPDRALQARLQATTRWQLDGKLAVRTSRQSDSARLSWQQQDDSFDIRLSGPAGLSATHIYGMPGGVRFEQGERRESAGSAEALSERLIGWPLPASEMGAWLRGLPSPDRALRAVRYNQEGCLAELEQADWLIRFSDYRHLGELVLPGRIEASRGDTRITLVIKQWQLP